MKTYYMFGDSLMRGVMPDEAWNYHSSDAIGFEKMQAQYNMKFVNYAMPTFTSERVKMWLTQVMSSHPVPDVAFLECGGNDCDYNWKSICEGRCDYEHRHRVAHRILRRHIIVRMGCILMRQDMHLFVVISKNILHLQQVLYRKMRNYNV